MNANTQLLIRCDDLGSFRGANLAIIQLLGGPLCRNAGLMVPADHFNEATAMASAVPKACLGLHATLNSEWETTRWRPILPASRVPCLVEADGTLKRTPNALHDAGADFEQMLAEIAAQLTRARNTGLEIDYLDQHMCFGWVHEPGHPETRFESVLADFARKEGLHYFASVATPQGQGTAINDHPLHRFQPTQDGSCSAETACAALSEAAEAGGSWLWVSHPARSDAELAAAYLAGQKAGDQETTRTREWQTLADPEVAATAQRLGIRCIAVTDL